MDHDVADMTDLRRSNDSWVLLGTIGAGGRVHLDRHGVLSPESGAWSLDWWVRAEDRWHLASDGALVRQSLTESTPVVLSALRVPGGEIEQRSWCTVDGASGAPLLIAEYHNATAVPVALALALRCGDAERPDQSPTITFDGAVVSSDGSAIARFSREPSRYAFERDGRSAAEVTIAEDAVSVFPVEGIRASSDRTAAAFVFPLPHTATLRVILALETATEFGTIRRADLSTIDFAGLAPHDRVVAGWKSQLARSPRIDLPERGIEEALDGARAHLLVHAAADDPLRSPGVVVSGLEHAEMVMTLDEQGLSSEAERLLLSAIDRQNADGSFDPDRLDATASWIVAVERHIALTADLEFAESCIEHVASAAHWLAKRQRGTLLRRSTTFFAKGEGPIAFTLGERIGYDARWTRRAYSAAISLLNSVDQRAAASAVDSHLNELVDEMQRRSIPADGPGDGAAMDDAIGVLRSDLLEGEPLWTWAGDVDAHDPARTLAFLRNVRSIVVNDSNNIVDLLPGFGEQWLGQPIAVLRLPSAAGSVSFALRWHGARPALLWEVEGDRALNLSCSAIDPSWSTTDSRGEVLLAAPVLDHDHDHDHDHGHSDVSESKAKSVADPPVDGGGSFT